MPTKTDIHQAVSSATKGEPEALVEMLYGVMNGGASEERKLADIQISSSTFGWTVMDCRHGECLQADGKSWGKAQFGFYTADAAQSALDAWTASQQQKPERGTGENPHFLTGMTTTPSPAPLTAADIKVGHTYRGKSGFDWADCTVAIVSRDPKNVGNAFEWTIKVDTAKREENFGTVALLERLEVDITPASSEPPAEPGSPDGERVVERWTGKNWGKDDLDYWAKLANGRLVLWEEHGKKFITSGLTEEKLRDPDGDFVAVGPDLKPLPPPAKEQQKRKVVRRLNLPGYGGDWHLVVFDDRTIESSDEPGEKLDELLENYLAEGWRDCDETGKLIDPPAAKEYPQGQPLPAEPVQKLIGRSPREAAEPSQPTTPDPNWTTKDGKRVKEGDTVKLPTGFVGHVQRQGFARAEPKGLVLGDLFNVSDCTSIPPSPPPVEAGESETVGTRMARKQISTDGNFIKFGPLNEGGIWRWITVSSDPAHAVELVQQAVAALIDRAIAEDRAAQAEQGRRDVEEAVKAERERSLAIIRSHAETSDPNHRWCVRESLDAVAAAIRAGTEQ